MSEYDLCWTVAHLAQAGAQAMNVPLREAEAAIWHLVDGRPPCAFGDPTCPCQDGDPCHYIDLPGSPAMTQPAAHPGSSKADRE